LPSRLQKGSAAQRLSRNREVRESLINKEVFDQTAYKDFPFLASPWFHSSIPFDSHVIRDTFGIQRRDRLHTYKRPCWALSLRCPGPDSNRAAGLHPESGEYIPCSAWRFVEFARCRSDLSLSMRVESLYAEFPMRLRGLYA
jgi:hypothetical protein